MQWRRTADMGVGTNPLHRKMSFRPFRREKLTPSTPAVPNCCSSKGPELSARAPECQKLKMMG